MRIEFLRDFQMENTQIWICTKWAGMGLNLRDIARAIQWKILDHCTVANMLQWLSRYRRNGQQAVALIFVEKKHILPDGIDELEGLDFIHLRSPVEMTNKRKIQEIVSKFYEHNLKITRKKNLTAYHRVDPAILWFVNSTSCCQQFAFAYFICKRAFCTMSYEPCWHNCLYAKVEKEDTPLLNLHDETARQSRAYFLTSEWQDASLAAERDRLLAHEVVSRIKTTAAQ